MAAEQEPMDDTKPRRCSMESGGSRSRSTCGCDNVGAGGCAGMGAGAGGVWGAAVAEFMGTALLVLVPCLCPPELPALHKALAAAATVTMLVQCFDHISLALVNPAVLLAAVLAGRVCWRRATALLPAQLLGGIAGAWLLTHLAGPVACSACVTVPGAGVGGCGAAGVEAVLSGALSLACCSAWDPRSGPKAHTWPLRLGGTVAALVLAGGGLTGGSMNPARSLGPALLSNNFHSHWVYWVGPLGGAAGAALLYRALWGAPLSPPPPPTRCPHHATCP